MAVARIVIPECLYRESSKIIMSKQPCVYILANRRNGTIYVGVTSDLIKRVWEHKNDIVQSFTEKYKVHMLVWFEPHGTMERAIQREKQIKKWNRKWKLDLIDEVNPLWNDLYQEMTGFPLSRE